jgi:hypothetical protein
MRCPKCGYISFDHLESCINCSKDFSDLTSATIGTTYSVSAPSFLKFSAREELDDHYADTSVLTEGPEDHGDIVDPDLDILIKDEEEGIDFHADDLSLNDEFAGSDDDFSISLNDEKGEDAGEVSEINLSDFEDTIQEAPEEEQLTMSLPDELTDLSDLAPPESSGKEETPPSPAGGRNEEAEILDLDLDLEGLDTGFSLTSPAKGGEDEGLANLSLEDIDTRLFGEEIERESPPAPQAAPAAKTDAMDMDADLDFDLDLGGLSLPKK